MPSHIPTLVLLTTSISYQSKYSLYNNDHIYSYLIISGHNSPFLGLFQRSIILPALQLADVARQDEI